MINTDRRTFLNALGMAAANVVMPEGWESNNPSVEGDKFDYEYTLAAYYFGNYHVDPRNEAAHGPGWTEWRLVQAARPRFAGHAQPKMPLWGYENESDPVVFERKIKTASEAGLSALIFDWYWYNDGPFLQAALEKGFLGAANRDDLKFAIMWANHDWFDIQPAKLTAPSHLQFPGKVTLETFDRLTDHIVRNYFKVPNYWTVDGCPYFSIYELYNFIESMGSVGKAASALKQFREKTKAAGFQDLHLNAIAWGVQLPSGETSVRDLKSLLEELQVDSTTSYVWIHHVKMTTFPVMQYDMVARDYERYRAMAASQFGRPYLPNVSMGWDSSPRACQSDIYVASEYPFMPVVQGNTPEAFRKALHSAKVFLDETVELKHKILTINSWNEWTEGSYLEPDTQNEYKYLNQISEVFSKAKTA